MPGALLGAEVAHRAWIVGLIYQDPDTQPEHDAQPQADTQREPAAAAAGLVLVHRSPLSCP